MPRFKATLFLLSLATAFVPATLAAQSTNGAVPGTISFVQGQANVDGQPLHSDSTSMRQLRSGETIATANGSADILLAPGALLRLGHDTTVQMVTADPGRSEIQLEQGLINLSINTVRHDDLLLVDLPHGQTQMLSRGLYSFNSADSTIRVFNGEADVFPGADTRSDIKPVKLKEGHEIVLGGDRAKPAKFDREFAEADLVPWSGLQESRSALASDGGVPAAGYGVSSYGDGGYGTAVYGFGGPYPYGSPYFAYDGFGYPWAPYGLWGYPFFGVGFGFYGGRGFYGRPFLPGRGFYGGRVGGYAGRGYGGGYAPHAFAGGGFHGGGFGGFHGGGGRR